MKEELPQCPICTSGSRFYAEKSGHRIFVCARCGFGFVHPAPDENSLSILYGESYYRNIDTAKAGYADYDKDKESMKRVFELYLGKLARITSVKRIFDFGAATGYFLDLAKDAGWDTYGNEISRYAKEEATRRGHMIYDAQHDVSATPLVGTMGAVTMWDVLEHVPDPLRTLSNANCLLVTGGVIAINTVDRSSLWARLLGPRWHLMIPPEHLNYFSRESLRRALERSGFEVIEIVKTGKSFSLSYIFKTLANWQKLKCWNVLAQISDNGVLRKISIPINLRDNMFVLAKKIKDVE